jgi:AcrR family transcriptional regulator
VLDQGDVLVSMDAVAEHAGVSKATIYRWWPSREMLVLDALRGWVAQDVPERDTGSLRGDLHALVLSWVRESIRLPFARLIAALIAKAHVNAEFAGAYHSHFFDLRRAPARAALARAIARGEASASLDIEAAIDLVYGPIYHRLLHGHAPLTEQYARAVVDFALSGMLIEASGGRAAPFG